eukprot:NODE_266_length_12318_cov_0.301498.p7 type:complete len:120 gc:universal NODE_266_length_12318_cov_0.301498:8330-7971(-)
MSMLNDCYGLVDVLAPIGYTIDGYQVNNPSDEVLVSLIDSPYETLVIYDLYATYSKTVECECCMGERHFNQNYEWTGYLLKQLSATKLVYLVRTSDKDYFTSLSSFHVAVPNICLKSVD